MNFNTSMMDFKCNVIITHPTNVKIPDTVDASIKEGFFYDPVGTHIIQLRRYHQYLEEYLEAKKNGLLKPPDPPPEPPPPPPPKRTTKRGRAAGKGFTRKKGGKRKAVPVVPVVIPVEKEVKKEPEKKYFKPELTDFNVPAFPKKYPFSQPEKEAGKETEKKVGKETEKEAGKEVEIVAEIKAKKKSGKKSEIRAEKESEVKAEKESEVKAEKESEVKAEKESEVKAEKESEIEAGKETEKEAGKEAEKEAVKEIDFKDVKPKIVFQYKGGLRDHQIREKRILFVKSVFQQAGYWVEETESDKRLLEFIADNVNVFLRKFVRRFYNCKTTDPLNEDDDLWGPLDSTLIELRMGGITGVHHFYREHVKKHDILYNKCVKLHAEYKKSEEEKPEIKKVENSERKTAKKK